MHAATDTLTRFSPPSPLEAGEGWLRGRLRPWLATNEPADVLAAMAHALAGHLDPDGALGLLALAPLPEDATRGVDALCDKWRALLAQARPDSPLWRFAQEEHALGWALQHLGEGARQESFRALHQEEAKHHSATVSTQLFTPRWIADLLAGSCLDLWDAQASAARRGALPTILDPAAGGGQMLLAALSALRVRYPQAAAHQLADCLWGVDLDPAAAGVARLNLKWALARHFGGRCPEAERRVDARVVAGDGLGEPGQAGLEPGGADIVLANPPYMGTRAMSLELKERLRRDFAPLHGDLYVAFLRRCQELARVATGVLAQQTVWFLGGYEPARRWLLGRGDLRLFVHLGPHAFASLTGEKASVVAYVQCAGTMPGRTCRFVDLREARRPADKRQAWLEVGTGLGGGQGGGMVRDVRPSAFGALPGAPLAHWLTPEQLAMFESLGRLGDVALVPGGQNKTGDNARFVRAFGAVPPGDIRPVPGLWPLEALEAETPEDFAGQLLRGLPERDEARGGLGARREHRWVFYSKGGAYAPWWGNWQWVVDWSEEARAFYRHNRGSNLLAENLWYREGLCYTDFGGKRFNARWMPPGCLFDMTGPAIFLKEQGHAPLGATERRRRLFALLAIVNSTTAREVLWALNPSLHFQVRDVRALPIPPVDDALVDALAPLAARAIALCWWQERRAGAPGAGAQELARVEAAMDARVSEAYAQALAKTPAPDAGPP